MGMRVLTIWQPYASAIALGLKKYETRSWQTRHRGPIAIHASVKPLNRERMALAKKYNILDKLEFGKIVVICDLIDCIPMTDEFIAAQSDMERDFGDWRVGRFAWKLRVVRVIMPPISAGGRQGIWRTDLFPEFDNANR